MSAGIGPVLALCVLLLTSCGQGGGGEAIAVTATVNGVAAADSEPNDPITLYDGEVTELGLVLENLSDETQNIRYIRFEGNAIDMVFLTYGTATDFELAPGATRETPSFLFDFFDLGAQANGYLRGHVQVFDTDSELLGSQEVFFDAQGSGFSTLTWFNLLLLAATIGGAAWNLVRLAQRRLPSNRFIRALRFLAIGALAGITLATAFSTLRLWPLDTLGWVLFTVIGGLAGYVIGFLLPGADDSIMDLLDEQDVLDAVIDDETDDDTLKGDTRDTIKLD